MPVAIAVAGPLPLPSVAAPVAALAAAVATGVGGGGRGEPAVATPGRAAIGLAAVELVGVAAGPVAPGGFGAVLSEAMPKPGGTMAGHPGAGRSMAGGARGAHVDAARPGLVAAAVDIGKVAASEPALAGVTPGMRSAGPHGSSKQSPHMKARPAAAAAAVVAGTPAGPALPMPLGMPVAVPVALQGTGPASAVTPATRPVLLHRPEAVLPATEPADAAQPGSGATPSGAALAAVVPSGGVPSEAVSSGAVQSFVAPPSVVPSGVAPPGVAPSGVVPSGVAPSAVGESHAVLPGAVLSDAASSGGVGFGAAGSGVIPLGVAAPGVDQARMPVIGPGRSVAAGGMAPGPVLPLPAARAGAGASPVDPMLPSAALVAAGPVAREPAPRVTMPAAAALGQSPLRGDAGSPAADRIRSSALPGAIVDATAIGPQQAIAAPGGVRIGVGEIGAGGAAVARAGGAGIVVTGIATARNGSASAGTTGIGPRAGTSGGGTADARPAAAMAVPAGAALVALPVSTIIAPVGRDVLSAPSGNDATALRPATAQLAAAMVGVTPIPDGNTGGTRLTIAMAPPAIGMVGIQIDRGADGIAAVVVSASHPVTLAALQTDHAALAQMLNQAGIVVDHRSISFHLEPAPAGGAAPDGAAGAGVGFAGPGQQSGQQSGQQPGQQPGQQSGQSGRNLSQAYDRGLAGDRRDPADPGTARTAPLRRRGVDMMA